MIIKITDGYTSHFIEFSGDLRVDGVECVYQHSCSFADAAKEPTAEYLEFLTEQRPGENYEGGVQLRPEGLPLRTYRTNWDVYLMSDKGKTVEVLHRML